MAKYKVLVTRRIPEEGLELLAPDCDVELNPHDRPMSRSELLAAAADKDGVLCLLTDKIDAEFFDAAPRVKGLANYAGALTTWMLSRLPNAWFPCPTPRMCSPLPGAKASA